MQIYYVYNTYINIIYHTYVISRYAEAHIGKKTEKSSQWYRQLQLNQFTLVRYKRQHKCIHRQCNMNNKQSYASLTETAHRIYTDNAAAEQ